MQKYLKTIDFSGFLPDTPQNRFSADYSYYADPFGGGGLSPRTMLRTEHGQYGTVQSK